MTTVNKNITEQATGEQVISYLVKDLTEAAALLKDYDPVCGVHDAAFTKKSMMMASIQLVTPVLITMQWKLSWLRYICGVVVRIIKVGSAYL